MNFLESESHMKPFAITCLAVVLGLSMGATQAASSTDKAAPAKQATSPVKKAPVKKAPVKQAATSKGVPAKTAKAVEANTPVQTLSERLLLRDMGSAVAYDGESALEMLREDEPEVMILDLKMPGIDGMEVLRQVKATQPDIEVIILTGHGNETDRETCMGLGAFAYLQKPVDIDVLSETMKQANEKIQARKQAQQGA